MNNINIDLWFASDIEKQFSFSNDEFYIISCNSASNSKQRMTQHRALRV